MKLPISLEQSRAAVDEALGEVQQYCDSSAVKSVASLLDAMVEHYRVMLETATPESLATLQAAVKQCTKLRAALPRDGERPTFS